MPVDKPGQRLQRLREAGFKLTNARVKVLDVLEASDDHLTSTQVIDAVNELDAGIGRASVFRSLDLLTSLAIIRPTYIDSSVTPKYVLLPDGHHHHIVCTGCNKVIEFNDCGLTDLARRLETEYAVKITGHLLEFFARCDGCSLPEDADE
jgi:Fur family ferric uptake transcriptional regulator